MKSRKDLEDRKVYWKTEERAKELSMWGKLNIGLS